MTAGTVKWFNGTKGFGFTAPESRGKDVFVRRSSLEGSGYNELSEGLRVDYESEPGAKGRRATRVRRA